MDSRRNFLGTAALGAGGLAMLTSAASADAVKPDASNPGDGGFGGRFYRYRRARQSFITIPGDVGEMPEFAVAWNGSKPKVTSGGWAKESTVHQLPIMTDLAGASTDSLPEARGFARAALARNRG